MNPYSPPKIDPEISKVAQRPVELEISGPLSAKPCAECGSNNVRAGSLLHSRPSLIMIVLFSWNYLLIRAAWVKKEETCLDCGARRKFRSTGNNVALFLLIILLLLVLVAIFEN